jgi:hypothetical protein
MGATLFKHLCFVYLKNRHEPQAEVAPTDEIGQKVEFVFGDVLQKVFTDLINSHRT